MLGKLCSWLLYKRLGWTKEVTQPHPEKFIICLAPHTSNWDFALGQIRQKKMSMTDAMADTAKKVEQFKLCITPEGTRSRVEEWKKGFYFIALKAGIPILLYGVDYERKLIQCTKTIIPSGNLEEDMREIKLYFKDFKGRKPENFAIGDIE